MEILTGIAIIVSVIALCVSYHSATKGNEISSTANDLTKTALNMQKMANDMQMAQIEMQIRQLISDARSRFQDKVSQLSKKQDNEIMKSIVDSAKEDYLNAYDEACAKYNDGKVDKIRFKKLYHNEIRQLVTDETNIEKYREPGTKYHATLKVFKEWNDLENNL